MKSLLAVQKDWIIVLGLLPVRGVFLDAQPGLTSCLVQHQVDDSGFHGTGTCTCKFFDFYYGGILRILFHPLTKR